MSFLSELQRLDAVEKFKNLCRITSSSAALREWSIAAGVEKEQVPKCFKKIRQGLGVSGKHGGQRATSRDAGALRIYKGEFVKPSPAIERKPR